MDIQGVLQRVDELFEQNKGQQAEALMQESILAAMEEQDDASLLQLLNELLGYYRETSQVENSFAVAEQAVSLAQSMGLENSIPYATTLLNVANAYRAGGRLEESLAFYMQVREIYDAILAPDNLLVASLENNISLLYQELSLFSKAKVCLLKALPIVEKKQAAFETAVTYANLANTCIQLNEMEESFAYAQKGIQCFEKMGMTEDTHYGAILSALGTYYYKKKEYRQALDCFQKSQQIMEKNLGRNEYYHRLQESISECKRAMAQMAGQAIERETDQSDDSMQGLAICRDYYETYGKPMIERDFASYADKIAVGLVGKGSDCFGYDDVLSRDHDWGPDFCMWVTEETYAEIGERLQQAYENLPTEFQGYKRIVSPFGKGRRGVMTISAFYKNLVQADKYEEIDWRNVSDSSLAVAVNGEIFRDDEGIFSEWRQKLQTGYPLELQFLKMAESGAHFAQAAQYNYGRVCSRGDALTAQIMLVDGIREAMKLQHYIEGRYPVHDKWLYKSLAETEKGKQLQQLLQELMQMEESGQGSDSCRMNRFSDKIEQIAAFLVAEMYGESFISDSENYVDAHTEELLYKAGLAGKAEQELVEAIAKLEFEAFDKVHNEGGRASCQNDWATFSIMRKSQYLTWNKPMLMQYLYDFHREYQRGHNLIEEKYGRMMESTAPDEYEKIKNHFPMLSEEKKQIIEQIVGLQVSWMEEFAAKYPDLADNARSVHTSEDNRFNTSYETYLRGEISTYSDKMLELYGRYVVEYAANGRNLTFDIMTNSVHLYGYKSLDAAEAFLKQ